MQMCKEMHVNLLGKVPLDPSMVKCCEDGKSFVNCHGATASGEAFKSFTEACMTSTPNLSETWQSKE